MKPAARSRIPTVVVVLLGLALLVRVGAMVVVDGDKLRFDAYDYWRHGLSLSSAHQYPPSNLVPGGQPSAFRPPGYPYFLGGVTEIRESMRAVRAVQVLLGVLAVALLGWIAARVFGRTAGIATLGLAAVYPPLVMASAPIMSEALFLPLAVGVIASALWAADSPEDRRRLALVGLLAGLATLTRFNGILLLIPAALIVAMSGPAGAARRARWARAGIVAGVLVLCLVPWTVRNAVVMHAFVPVALEEGVQLAGVMNDQSRNNKELPAAWAVPSRLLTYYTDIYDRRATMNEPEFNSALTKRALKYLTEHPGYGFIAVFWHSVRMLHFGSERLERSSAVEGNVPFWTHEAGRYAFYLLVVLALAGLIAVRPPPLWMWTTPLLFFFVGAAAAGLIRYRYPADLFLLLLAGAGLAAIAERRAGSRPAAAN